MEKEEEEVSCGVDRWPVGGVECWVRELIMLARGLGVVGFGEYWSGSYGFSVLGFGECRSGSYGSGVVGFEECRSGSYGF